MFLLLLILIGVYYLRKNSEQMIKQKDLEEVQSELSNLNLNSEVEEGVETAISGVGIFPGLREGDYVDIRITYPNGENYVVLNRKRLCEIREERGESIYLFQMTAKEQLWYSSAQSDLKTYDGSSLTAVRYISPKQQASTVTYLPNRSVLILYSKDGNIIENEDSKQLTKQREELEQRLKEQKTKETDFEG